jgi:dimeric dUTPase (all-alpha-NTP-PPase superfamily)
MLTIRELISKQLDLDAVIAEEKKLGNPYHVRYFDKTRLALFTEIGEYANETRCFKYWSQKKPAAKEVQLEELVDILHFTLKLMVFKRVNLPILYDEYMQKTLKDIFVRLKCYVSAKQELTDHINCLFVSAAARNYDSVLERICTIAIHQGYTPEELEEAYLRKREINIKRQEEKY